MRANKCEFKFVSNCKHDNEEEKISFIAKGYSKEENNLRILYFKYDNSYKFIIKENELEVEVNQSRYKFKENEKTEAMIVSGNYYFQASVQTNKLIIDNHKIEIDYLLEFNGFKGKYQIILESH